MTEPVPAQSERDQTSAADDIERAEDEDVVEVRGPGCNHWPGQTRCLVCGMGAQPGEAWYA